MYCPDLDLVSRDVSRCYVTQVVKFSLHLLTLTSQLILSCHQFSSLPLIKEDVVRMFVGSVARLFYYSITRSIKLVPLNLYCLETERRAHSCSINVLMFYQIPYVLSISSCSINFLMFY